MDLWILSQDKHSMCKATFLKIGRNCFSEWCVFDNDNELGGYATKERALEVLGKIQKLLMGELIVLNHCPTLNDEELKSKMDYALVYGAFENNNSSSVDFIHRDCVVFEMPEN